MSSKGKITADGGKHAIEKLSANGRVLAQWGGPDRELQLDPVGVAVDRRGLVYVTDVGDGWVKVLAADGTMPAEWGRNDSRPGEFRRPSALAVDRDGNVYVADSGNNRIQKLTYRR